MAQFDSTPLSRPFGDIPISAGNAPVEVLTDARWHPKITVYRLLVISTTISLGSAKAVETFNGKLYVSTTIEWITGVAVFSLLFVVGWFEEDRSEYPKLAWLVDYDLIRLIWSPNYISEERQRTEGAFPLITTYRLLVSGSVFIFGMGKACLSYVGLGGAANVLDWIFGVVVTSTLYVLGLYEYNSVNMMPYLFERHYDDQFYSGKSFFFGIVLYLIGGAFTVWLSLMWRIVFQQLNAEIYDYIKQEGFPTSFNQFHHTNTKFGAQGVMLLFLLLSIGCSLYCLREIVLAFGRLTPFQKLTKLLRRAFLWTRATISRPFGGFEIPKWAERAGNFLVKIFRFVRHFGVHILIFTAASVVGIIMAFHYLGLLFETFFDPDTKDPNVGLVGIILYMIFDVFVSGYGWVVACIGIFLSIKQVLRPFSQDLNDVSRDKLFLEF